VAPGRRDFQGALHGLLALDFRHVNFVVEGVLEWPDIRRGEIDGAASHGEFEPGIGQRGGDAVPRFLHRRIRQADDDDEGIPPAAIDLHLDGEGFDTIDRSGQNTGKHGRIVAEHGRKGNAVFCADANARVLQNEPIPSPLARLAPVSAFFITSNRRI